MTYTLARRPPEWMADGLCAQTDPDLFYPDLSSPSRFAKRVCNGNGPDGDPDMPLRAPCPVKDKCLAYALDNNEKYGVWGGTSERERREMRRKMREAADADAEAVA